MNVSDAIRRRMSVRAFRPDPVPGALVRRLITEAARAPSGGNLQPWHVHALTGEPLETLLGIVADEGPDAAPAYAIYPKDLGEPYRTRRYENGEQLYASIDIPREDKPGRLRQLARNTSFFGAPVGLFVLIDRTMGPPQWTDLGLYLQNFMLLAVEAGLDTCPQEFWALYARKVEAFLEVPATRMLFCGVALGYRDEDAPINRLATTRAAPAEWAALHGFEDA